MSSKEMTDEYARYKYMIENIKDVIWEVDENVVFTFISPTVKDMTGYGPEEMIGRSLFDFITDDSKSFLLSQINNPAYKEGSNRNQSRLHDVEFICKSGRTIWLEVSAKPIFKDDAFLGYIGASRDITEKKNYEQMLRETLENQRHINAQLEDMATFDMLTGAYNRRKFELFIAQEMEKAVNYGALFSICIFDIDNFKQINDVFGHSKGDRVLQELTALIKFTLRETDKMFRWGGDEFIVLFPDISLDNALKVTRKIKETIQSHEFDSINKNVTVSMGVGEYSREETSEQFVIRVDRALLRAKNNGKNIIELG